VADVILAMHKQLSADQLVDCIGQFESFVRAICTDLENNPTDQKNGRPELVQAAADFT